MIGLILVPMALVGVTVLFLAPLLMHMVVIIRNTLHDIVEEIEEIWEDRE